MNKTDLASRIAEKHDLTKAEAMAILNTTLSEITTTVVSGEDVTFNGFGTFRKVHKPARTARNPQTGEAIQVEAKDVPRFVPGCTFEGAVKNSRVAVGA